MGWLFFRKPDNVKQYFDDQINNEERGQRVLDSAIVNMREYYAAVEERRPDGRTRVIALVIMLRFVPRAADGYTFGYKDMTEFCGPWQTSAPERILKLLTPFEPGDDPHGSATAWREACWEKVKERKGKPALRDGVKIRISNPPTHQGVLLDVVEVRRSGRSAPRFYHPQIGTFRWPWIKQVDYQLA